jgi:hypothetical protein
MKPLILIIAISIVGCDHFPVRNLNELDLKRPMSVSDAQARIDRTAIASGFVKTDCPSLTYKSNDASANALIFGSTLLRRGREFNCYVKKRDPSKHNYIDAYLVIRQDDPKRFSTEIWTPNTKNEALLGETLSDFWFRLGTENLFDVHANY